MFDPTPVYISRDREIVPGDIYFLRTSLKIPGSNGMASPFFERKFFVENANLPKVSWWQKLKKLFEIEESYYKQARESFAANNLDDVQIYSGLARTACSRFGTL